MDPWEMKNATSNLQFTRNFIPTTRSSTTAQKKQIATWALRITRNSTELVKSLSGVRETPNRWFRLRKSKKNILDFTAPQKPLCNLAMRGAKKRRSLTWRPNPACCRWPFNCDNEQLFKKSLQNVKFLYTTRTRGAKKRGSLRRANPACCWWSFTFYMRFRRSPWPPPRSTRFRQPDRCALTGRISRG